jgi:hypothetical protein
VALVDGGENVLAERVVEDVEDRAIAEEEVDVVDALRRRDEPLLREGEVVDDHPAEVVFEERVLLVVGGERLAAGAENLASEELVLGGDERHRRCHEPREAALVDHVLEANQRALHCQDAEADVG